MSKMATREAYGKALVEFGEDKRIVVLDADLSGSTNTSKFKAAYPDRFFDMGIAEANMTGVAAGLATTGKISFISSFAAFASMRNCEQIRNSVCYPNLNVKVCATHAGLSVGEDGASHQCLEDLAVMRSIPNIKVVSPCDGASTRMAIKAAIETDGPFYIRLGRSKVEDVYGEYGEDVPFTLGKANTLREGNDVTIIATGLMVQTALSAHDILKDKGINARVLDMHTIKPIDKEAILKASSETGLIITAEEHTINGGLGSAVAEVVCENAPCPVKRFGVNDRFGQSGTPDALFAAYKLTAADLAEKCENAIREIKG
ncbi:MAG: transketolase family protein [Clostridiales bacterium]|nr:transketolase family protein [Clostridiales bacterium]